MSTIHAGRLEQLSQAIQDLDLPLGTTKETGCWGAFAAKITDLDFDATSVEYGLTEEEFDSAVSICRSLPPTVRNQTMISITEQYREAVMNR